MPAASPTTRHTAAVSRDGTRAWELRTHFSENLDANGLDAEYPAQSARIPELKDIHLDHFKRLVDAGSAQFLLYVKDVLSDFSTRDFGEPGRLPISLAFPDNPFPSEWSPAEADGAAWAAIGDALAASTTHDRATTTQFFRSTPVKAINSSNVVLPAGLPAPVVGFVVHTVAQQLALCELLYTSSASKAALAKQLHKVHGVDLDARTSAIPHLFDGYFFYLTVDICHVDAGSPQRAPGVHSDGLRDDERDGSGPNAPNSHGLVASTSAHTAYYDAPFAVPEDAEIGVPGVSREAAFLPWMAEASASGRKYAPAEGGWALHLSSGLQLHSATAATASGHRLFLRGTFSTQVFNEFGRTTRNPTGSLATMLNPLLGQFEDYRD
jgi:hypothetical protein